MAADTTTDASIEARLCAVIARASEGDPVGHATLLGGCVVVEVPTPWSNALLEPDAAGSMFQRMRVFQYAAYEAAGPNACAEMRGQFLLGVAPDPEWSHPDRPRVWLLTRPAGLGATLEVAEYLVDPETAVSLAEAAFLAPERLPQFEAYRVPGPPSRDLLVCTHGAVDICCAKLGYPLYRDLRARTDVRAWRAMHFGGHRFAPTLIDLPSGNFWAFLDGDISDAVIRETGTTEAIAGYLRGWCALPTVAQVVDRGAFIREGWSWLATRRSGEVLLQDEAAGLGRARITFERADGSRGAYVGDVSVARRLPEVGCGPTYGSYDYHVEDFRLDSLVLES